MVKLTGHCDVLDNGFKEDKNEREDIPDIAGAESEPGRRLEMLGRYRLYGGCFLSVLLLSSFFSELTKAPFSSVMK